MKSFSTHLGELVTGSRLQEAVNAVADDMVRSAYAIYKENAYASHVTDERKDNLLQKSLQSADEVRSGKSKGGFWLWQRIDTFLTGECVAFLPA